VSAFCFYSFIPIGLQLKERNDENDMITWIKKIFTRLLQYEQCVATFTLSCCMGIYIAFCPFVGFHTAMVFLFSWLFPLNFSVVLAISMMINNPWTMLPVYGLSYFCGDWILSWFGVNHYAWNPSWVSKGNEVLANYVSFSGFSFWAFMIGGNFLGFALALLAYPIIKKATTMMVQGKTKVMNTVIKSKEAVRSLAKRVAAHKTDGKEHASSGTK
jgi:uncharacterized protein (DUF2062 family)